MSLGDSVLFSGVSAAVAMYRNRSGWSQVAVTRPIIISLNHVWLTAFRLIPSNIHSCHESVTIHRSVKRVAVRTRLDVRQERRTSQSLVNDRSVIVTDCLITN